MKTMTKKTILCIVILIIGFGNIATAQASAHTIETRHQFNISILDPDILQNPTPTPEVPASLIQRAGEGDGLIFIGSIIVLIILAGMIFASRRQK